jgi:Arc/MetJ-type ribon-helix-helix transcriptional regulator
MATGQSFYGSVNNAVYAMTTVQVQVRVPEKVVQEIDRWISEGRFANRSEAIKTVLVLYQEMDRTRKFYQTLLERSEQAKRKPDLLIPLEEIS